MESHDKPGAKQLTGSPTEGALARGRGPGSGRCRPGNCLHGRDAAVAARTSARTSGPWQALTSVGLEIPAGQVTSPGRGPMAAGKSTLIKTISGIWEPSHGYMVWQGKRGALPHQPGMRRGQASPPCTRIWRVCDNLDIVENMLLGHEVRRNLLLDEVTMEKTAKQDLHDLRVTTVRNIRQPVGSLSAASARPSRWPRRSYWRPGWSSWTSRRRPSGSPRPPWCST